jgi:outer membrane lipoprotein-sorting protein
MNRAPILLAAALCAAFAGTARAAPNADTLIRAAFDNWRAKSSQTDVTMTVHRPDWERSLEMKAWTLGDDDALVRFIAPAKDAGNGTLKLKDETWVFNPKLNQVIKLPASMLAQSWMGSDFSYNDLSKADDLLTLYTHKLLSNEKDGTHTVYTIEADPKSGAPVVWGKLTAKVRDDGVMMAETYFDQDMKPVRAMTTDKVGRIGGRDYPVIMTMRPVGEPGKWTRIETRSGSFDVAVPSYVFTLSNLQNPRD